MAASNLYKRICTLALLLCCYRALMRFHRRVVKFWCHHYAISQLVHQARIRGVVDKAEVIRNWQVTKSRQLSVMLVTYYRYQE